MRSSQISTITKQNGYAHALRLITVLTCGITIMFYDGKNNALAQSGYGTCPASCREFCDVIPTHPCYYSADFCARPGTGCPIGRVYSSGCCCPPGHETPIIIDIAGDRIELTSLEDGVRFEMTTNGHKQQVSWTRRGSDDAWLVLDRNHNGRIDNSTELFGNQTPQPSNPAPNGFLALAVFDMESEGGNNDGLITPEDAIFSNLCVWRDYNHDGVSQPDEIMPLGSVGIEGVDLKYRESRYVDQHGNIFRYWSRIARHHGSDVGRRAWDVFLRVSD